MPTILYFKGGPLNDNVKGVVGGPVYHRGGIGLFPGRKGWYINDKKMTPGQGQWVIKSGGREYVQYALEHNDAHVYWLGDLPTELPPPPKEVTIYIFDSDKKKLFNNKFFYLDTSNKPSPVWRDAFDKLPEEYKQEIRDKTAEYEKKVTNAAIAAKQPSVTQASARPASAVTHTTTDNPTARKLNTRTPTATNGDPIAGDPTVIANAPTPKPITPNNPSEIEACNKAILDVRGGTTGGKRRGTRKRAHKSSGKRRQRSRRRY